MSATTELCRGAGLQASRCGARCNIAYYRSRIRLQSTAIRKEPSPPFTISSLSFVSSCCCKHLMQRGLQQGHDLTLGRGFSSRHQGTCKCMQLRQARRRRQQAGKVCNNKPSCCCFLCFKTIYQHLVQVFAAAAPGLLQKLGRVLREKAQGDMDRIRSGTSKTRERLGVGHISASISACLPTSAASRQADHQRCLRWTHCPQPCGSKLDVTTASLPDSS